MKPLTQIILAAALLGTLGLGTLSASWQPSDSGHPKGQTMRISGN